MATKEMVARHTEGPWRVGEMCGGAINIEADTAPRHITVGRIHVFDTSAEAEANARLIAAAPELFDALKYWVMAIELVATDSFCEVCRAHAPKDDDGHIIGPVVHYGCPFDQARTAIAKAEGR